MLDRIIAFSLRNRALVLAAALFVGIAGGIAALRMPIDVLPDLNRPVVTVLTEAHGMVPEDVERLVTWPIEQVVNGATGVHRVRSASATGLSVVWVDFEWGTDIYLDRQIVAEKIQLVGPRLPDGMQPVLAPVSSLMGQIQFVGFQSTADTDPTELRRVVDRDVVPRIRSLRGVAQVVTVGGQPTELQVSVSIDRMRAFGVTLEEVRDAILAANRSAVGNTIEIGVKGPVIAVPGLLATPAELASAVVSPDPHRPVTISDVAEVELGPAGFQVGEAGIDGRPGVILVVAKQPGTDTVELTDRVDAELAEIRMELPDDVVVIEDLFRQADFIHRAIDNVFSAILEGSLLVFLVLFAFLMNVRTTLITLSAVPLSIAVSALVFAALGLTIDTMTLGGLAVAIGVLVDDAIVDVENVFRRLHEDRHRSERAPVLKVVYDASREIRRPVVYGTLLVTVVYVPLFFLSGIEGRLFAPIGIAYIVSVMASLLVALTVTPAVCSYLLGSYAFTRVEYGGPVVLYLKRVAERMIRFGLAWPAHVAAIVLSATIALAVALFSGGSTFLPAFNEGSAQVNLMLPPDTSLATSEVFGRRLERMLLRIPGIESAARRTGRAQDDEHVMPVSVNEVVVTFDPEVDRSREEIIENIRTELGSEFPGVASEVEQPLQHLLDHLLSGVTAQIAIKISGPDLDVLRDAAKTIERAIAGIPGVRDLFVEPQVVIDQVVAEPRREVLARLGLTVADIADTVQLAVGREEVSRLRLDRISYPIVVRLRAEDRRDLDQIRGLYLRSAEGELARLGDVADVRVSRTPNEINRENVQRRIVVSLNVARRSLGEVVADVQRAIAPFRAELAALPGYGLRVSGQFEAQQSATRTILWLGLAALVAMLMILYMHFRSLLLASIVLLSRPIAFVGAFAMVLATGQNLSVATMVGFIALLGIAARNAILLVDHYLHLMRDEGESFTAQMLVRAGQERMAPILMTALTSGIGLLPLALAPDQPGREILYPVATVILGGLVSTTLLDFVVTPGLVWSFGRKEAERLAASRHHDELGAVL